MIAHIRIWSEYAVLIIVISVLKILPFCAEKKIGKLVAKFFCFIIKRDAKFIKYQMRACFHDKYSNLEYNELADKFYTHFGYLIAETVRLKTIASKEIDDVVDWNGLDEITKSLTEEYGKGVLFATGHIGNWELTGALGAKKGIIFGSIARPLNNLLINKKINEYRTYSGQKIWDKSGALLMLVKHLKRKMSVGILIDQDGGEQGLRVPFLGRPSSTNISIAELAIRFNVPIIPTAVVRSSYNPLQFKAIYGKPIISKKKEISKKEVYRILEEVNNELSDIIYAYPEQWLWIHKRWKTPNPSDNRKFIKR